MFSLTEKDIWHACLQGDIKAFEKLYKQYYPLLLNYGRKFSSDSDLIRDCIQNLFVKLISKHENLSATVSVKGYLLKAFRHHLYDAFQLKNAHEAMFLPCVDDLLSFDVNSLVAGEPDEQSENEMLIRSAYKKLSSRQQEILYLYYVTEASHTEISFTLNIHYQSSKNLLHRSLSKLKELFELEMEECKKTKGMLIPDACEYQIQIIPYQE